MNPSSSDANQKPTTLMEQAKKDNMTIISKTVGDEIILATLKLKVNRVEENQTISANYSSPKTAKEGAKFVIVNADLTNTTNKAFTMAPDLMIVDNKDREFNTYADSIGELMIISITRNFLRVLKKLAIGYTNCQQTLQVLNLSSKSQEQTSFMRFY